MEIAQEVVKNNNFNFSENVLNDYIITNYVKFIDEIKTRNILPLSGKNNKYSDDAWDLSNLTLNNKTAIISFPDINPSFKGYIKAYCIGQLLLNQKKISGIQNSIRTLKRMFFYMESKGLFNINLLNIKLIKEFVVDNLKDTTNQNQVRFITEIKQFLFFLNANMNCEFNIVEINELISSYSLAVKKESLSGKTEDIGEDYFNSFLSASIKTLNDKSISNKLRLTAGLYIILSQTGLRIGEILSLEADAMYKLKEGVYYLKYKTFKKVKGNKNYSNEITYVNKLTYHTYKVCEILSKNDRENLNLDFVFIFSKNIQNYPIVPNYFNSHYGNPYFVHLDKYFQTVYDKEIKKQGVTTKKYVRKINGVEKTYYLLRPKNHQFRVHVCTSLYEQGVPLIYIQKFMSHLTEQMTAYYVRPKKNNQENYEFSSKVLKDLVTNQAKPIGNDKGMVEKIQKFIKENNYNIETDLDTIVEKLSSHIAVRQKTGGVCIKSSVFRDCSNETASNEFYCAYGVCPNLFSFYYMINITFRKVQELEENIRINEKRNLIKQCQKDRNMLYALVNSRLKLEYEDLKERIQKEGKENILNKYPELEDVLNNQKRIEEVICTYENDRKYN